MKIAMVFDGLGIGGIEKVGIDYVNLFQKLGHEVTIYNLQPKLNEIVERYPKNCKMIEKKIPAWMLPDQYILGVKRWRWGKYVYPIAYFISKTSLNIFKMFCGKREKYDIAIAFAGHFRDLNFVTENFIKSNKKMCWLHGSLNDYLLWAPTFSDQYRKIKNLCVLSTQNQVATINANNYLSNLNIHKIYNPISSELNVNQEHVNEIRREYGKFILSVGRFDRDKDQKTIIKSCYLLKHEHNLDCKMIFLGDGPLLKECKDLAEKLGMKNNCVFLGTRSDVMDYYSAASIFVHSSPSEGLPTVILEALKCGTPVVATRSLPGVEEILQGNQFGLQCEVGNEKDMTEKIYQLIQNESLRHDYIEKGYERVKCFSYETIQKQLKDILEQLI